MNILSFESSCDETAVAVLQAQEHTLQLRSDAIASQATTHSLYGGVVPEIASRAHIEAISSLTEQALAQAQMTLADIDLIAVTSNPGLIGALLVGVSFAKALAAANSLPLVGVDHIKGHIAAAYIAQEGTIPPKPPFLSLVVSGGHTSFFLVENYNRHHVLGTTRDDAMGEAFDKVGRLLDLPYPAGAAFDGLAKAGFDALGTDILSYGKSKAAKAADWYLPTPALTGDACPDLSFSGPKTAAVNLMHHLRQKGETIDRPRFAAHFTHVAVSGVMRQLAFVMDQHPGLPVVLAGGVAANSHLRTALKDLCRKRGVAHNIPPLSLCGDNGGMIAAAGYYAYLDGERADSTLNASAADSL